MTGARRVSMGRVRMLETTLGSFWETDSIVSEAVPCLFEGTSKKHFVIFSSQFGELCLPSGKNFSIIIRNTNHDPCRYLNRHSWLSGRRFFFDACHSTFSMNLFRITDCTSQINNLIGINYELRAFRVIRGISFQHRT